MKIESYALYNSCIPLDYQKEQSNISGSRNSSAAILSLTSNRGFTGYGEGIYPTNKSIKGSHALSNDLKSIKKKVLNATVNSFSEIPDFINHLDNLSLASKCSVELGLIDLWSKQSNKSIANLFGLNPAFIREYGISIPDIPPALLPYFLYKSGIQEPAFVKIKIGNSTTETIEIVTSVKNFYNKDVRIRVDGQEKLSLAEARALIPSLFKNGITSFEQLLPSHDHEGQKDLMRRYHPYIDLINDESINSLGDLKVNIQEGLCNGINLKVSESGGIFNTIQMIKYAETNGVKCHLGKDSYDMGILRKAQGIVSGLARNIEYIEAFNCLAENDNPILNSIPTVDKNGIINWKKHLTNYGWGKHIYDKTIRKSWSSKTTKSRFFSVIGL